MPTFQLINTVGQVVYGYTLSSKQGDNRFFSEPPLSQQGYLAHQARACGYSRESVD